MVFLNGAIRLAISLNVIGVVAVVLNDLIRATDLVRKFSYSVIFS